MQEIVAQKIVLRQIPITSKMLVHFQSMNMHDKCEILKYCDETHFFWHFVLYKKVFIEQKETIWKTNTYLIWCTGIIAKTDGYVQFLAKPLKISTSNIL